MLKFLSGLPLSTASWVHEQSSLHVLIAVLVTMLLAGEVGFRAGRRQNPNEVGRGHFVAVQAALLALLALLLGFSLNMADQRYEARRASMMDDCITLASLNFRADFLPEPNRTEFKRHLNVYIGAHIEATSPAGARTESQFASLAGRAEELHHQMCLLVRSLVHGEHPTKGAAEMVGPLSDSLAIHRRWVTAMETNVPQPILVLLFATAFTAAGVVGYSGGLAQHRGYVQSTLLAVFVSGIIFVIHDLDTPLAGLSQAGQRPMIHLKSMIESEEGFRP
ncbi:MAG: hypothetical protein V4819_13975 [Verrucomicrobiota bacterium]